MNKEIRDKIKKAKRQENILKDALEFNYFNKEARARVFKDLKAVQIYILKLYLEDKNESR